MSIRPSLFNIIGAELSKEEAKLFEEFICDYGEMTVAELLKDDPVLSQEIDFPIPLDSLDVALEDIASYDEGNTVVGFYPVHHEEEARLHDHQLIWSLIESGILSGEAFEQKIPYQDYSASIGAGVEDLVHLPLSVRMEMRHYSGKWARKYKHSPLYYFDEELDISMALFHRMGIKLKPDLLQRFIVLEWG